jgi:hypothetical protein
MIDTNGNTEFADTVGWLLYYAFDFMAHLWVNFSMVIMMITVLAFIALIFSIILRIMSNEH